MTDATRKQKISYAYMHKLFSGVGLLAFTVIVAAGLMAEASVFTITWRAALVIIVISLVNRMVVSILSAYEEMNSGKP